MRYLISLLLTYTISCQPVFATLNEVDKASIFSKNLLANGGFENGKAKWTESAGTFTSPAGVTLVGNASVSWNASAAAQTLTSAAVTIPNGMYGRNGVVSCLIQSVTSAATYSLQAYDGSNILASATVDGSIAVPVRTSVNFIFPSSGSVQLRLVAATDEPGTYIDDCYLGPAEGYNMSSVSQATFVGAGYFAGTASCAWSRTNASPGDFTADTDCPAPTIITNPGPGTISTADDNLPQFTVNNLPPGIYEVSFNATIAMAASAYSALGISDGIASTQELAGYNAATTTNENVGVSRVFTYTSTGNRTFKLQTYASSGAVTIDGANFTLGFKIRRFPTSSEQAYTPDLQAMSWSGYHDSTCSWARTNAAYGDTATDASCGLTERTNMNFGTVTGANNLPSITFTPKRAGRYFVCANIYSSVSTVATVGYKMWDGTTTIAQIYSPSTAAVANYASGANLCGIYVASNTSAKTITIQTASGGGGTVTIAGAALSSAIEWSIFAIDQSLPAPVLTGSVTSSSSGVSKINYATVSSAGAVSSESGDWINGSAAVTDTSLFTITLNSIWSSTPICHVTPVTTDETVAAQSHIKTQSSSSIVVRTVYTNTGSNFIKGAFGFNITCTGAP